MRSQEAVRRKYAYTVQVKEVKLLNYVTSYEAVPMLSMTLYFWLLTEHKQDIVR